MNREEMHLICARVFQRMDECVMWLLGLRGRGSDGATVPAGTVHARERGQERLAPRGSQQLNCCFLLDYN